MHALISLSSKEICAYRKCALMRAVYSTTHFSRLTSTECTATGPPWLFASTSFEDVISKKETGNQGFEKSRESRQQNKPRFLRRLHQATAQIHVRLSAIALSPEKLLESSGDNNLQ